ncbi:hypothetical protein ACIQWN_37915 [Streptomyces vinaceus]
MRGIIDLGKEKQAPKFLHPPDTCPDLHIQGKEADDQRDIQ